MLRYDTIQYTADMCTQRLTASRVNLALGTKKKTEKQWKKQKRRNLVARKKPSAQTMQNASSTRPNCWSRGGSKNFERSLALKPWHLCKSNPYRTAATHASSAAHRF